MSSKIGDLIKPLFFKNDIVDPRDERGREKKEGGKNGSGENPGAEESDVVFFSIEAIGALLKQENAEGSKELLSKIAQLREHGIASIPVRQEQSILSAIEEAASFLKGR